MTRLMLYNIYRGGEGRLDKIVEVVNSVHPDFLGVLEAIGWGDGEQDTLKRFARDVGLPFAHFVKSNTKYDFAFLSHKETLTVKEFREGLWHSVMRAEFTLPELGKVALCLLHLNPHREKDRLKELERVHAIIAPYPRLILMGDFNSLSPHDPYDRAALLKTLQERGIEKFGKDKLQFDCLEFIESWGFLDVMQALRKPFAPTVPTPSSQDPMHAVPLRLDYIFISPALRPFLADATVLQNLTTEATSDHYPLVVDFSF